MTEKMLDFVDAASGELLNHVLIPNAPTTMEQLAEVLAGRTSHRLESEFHVGEETADWAWEECERRGLDVDVGVLMTVEPPRRGEHPLC